MEFTLEVSGDFLVFLDLNLKLTPGSDNRTVQFSTHRKETYTGFSIPNKSVHPRPHKIAIINHAIQRILQLPLAAEDQNREMAIIEAIASKNELEIDVKKMVWKKRLRLLFAKANTTSNPQPDMVIKREK